jgi:hypothetical protein
MDVNSKFNSFLNVYLQIINSSFPKKISTRGTIYNDEKIKDYYLKYSKILSKGIKIAKMLYYKNRIIHAHNKTKTTWKVINEAMGINSGKMKERGEKKNNEIQSLKVNPHMDMIKYLQRSYK